MRDIVSIFFLLLLFGAIPGFILVYFAVAIAIVLIGAIYINLTIEKEDPRVPEYKLINHPRRSAFHKLYKNAFDWPFVVFWALVTILLIPIATFIVAYKTIFNLK